MARPISVLDVTPEEKRELERRVGASTTPARDSVRAHIVLLRSEGVGQQEVASRLGVSAPSVSKWSQRFDREGLDGLRDKPGRGVKPSIPLSTVRRVVEEAGKAPPGRQRWSTRSLARELGISAHSVARIWQRQGLKPHRLRTFKVSQDKKFEEKFWDVVGLYLDPPARSLVLCCDEKTQCQALERTQPGLPLGRGHIRTRTHDYTRHGTITLFAALSYLEGKLIYRTEQHHTHVEWLRFLKQIDRETPADVDLHLIADKLLHAQAREGRELVEEAPEVPHALHSDLEFLDEHGGAFLRRPDAGLRPCRELQNRLGTGRRDHRLPRASERESEAVPVEGGRREDAGQDPPGSRGSCGGRTHYINAFVGQDTRGTVRACRRPRGASERRGPGSARLRCRAGRSGSRRRPP